MQMFKKRIYFRYPFNMGNSSAVNQDVEDWQKENNLNNAFIWIFSINQS